MNLTLDEAMEEYISYSKLKLKPQSISKIYNRYENQIKPLHTLKFSFLWHFYQKWSGKQDFSRTTCKSL